MYNHSENVMALDVLALGDGGTPGEAKRLQFVYTYVYTCMHVYMYDYIHVRHSRRHCRSAYIRIIHTWSQTPFCKEGNPIRLPEAHPREIEKGQTTTNS